MEMRPKGSGYKTQHCILEELRFATEPLWFEKIVVLLSGDRNKASRNLGVLVENGLITKRRDGHKIVYSLTEKGKHWSDWEGKIIIERLLAYQEPEEVMKKIEEWAKHLPPDFEDLALNDPELDRLWNEYSKEIHFLLEKEPRMKSLSPPEIIGWAKEVRKVQKEKNRKQLSFGARERRVGPYTKKASSFKPKE